MAIFTGKIEDAYYIKPDKSLIEIIYSQDSDVHQSHALFVDFDHPDFKDLLDEISLDQIEKNTKQRHKKQSKVYGNALNSAVSEYLEVELKNRKEKIEEELKSFRESWFKEREEEYEKKYGGSLEEQHVLLEKQRKELEKQRKELEKLWKKADTSWEEAKKTEVKLKRAWDEVKVSEDNSKKLFEQAEASWKNSQDVEEKLKASWDEAEASRQAATAIKKDIESEHEKTLADLEKVALNFEAYLTEQAQKFKESFNVDKELSKEDIDKQYRQMIDHYEELQTQTKNLKENIGFNYPNYINDLLYRTTHKLIEGQEQKDIAGEIVKNIIESNTVAALASHKKIDSNLLEVVMDNESEAAKEELFKLKLAIFEMEEVKKNKNKEQKSKIRKAPTKLKVLAEFDKLNV